MLNYFVVVRILIYCASLFTKHWKQLQRLSSVNCKSVNFTAPCLLPEIHQRLWMRELNQYCDGYDLVHQGTAVIPRIYYLLWKSLSYVQSSSWFRAKPNKLKTSNILDTFFIYSENSHTFWPFRVDASEMIVGESWESHCDCCDLWNLKTTEKQSADWNACEPHSSYTHLFCHRRNMSKRLRFFFLSS